jgi:RNA polymerase sigma-70 factor (ECF subfamily)
MTMTMTHSDPGSSGALVTDLVVRCGRGDDSALAELYELFHPMVGSLAVAQAPDREVTDVVLDAFSRLWRRASTFQPAVGSAVAWVLMELAAAVSGEGTRASMSPAGG